MIDHVKLALESDTYEDYIEAVAYEISHDELLVAVIWYMDEDDKRCILACALQDADFEFLLESEYDDITGHDNC